MENLDQKEIISKTTLKKESKDIKKFGEKLVKYNQEVLSKFNFASLNHIHSAMILDLFITSSRE